VRNRVLITGGARSRKSQFAVELAKETKLPVTFIATCIPKDPEMVKRIEEHRRARPKDWRTIEESEYLDRALLSTKTPIVIIDCLTLWLFNIMEKEVEVAIEKFLSAFSKNSQKIIAVTNEVGLGIVPDNELARRFRDMAGMLNQRVAELSNEVYLMVSGIPVKIKGG
jgi:adenosyl cobinamide kinase/adenosyl cobinamide phosphate guanylyltransferase